MREPKVYLYVVLGILFCFSATGWIWGENVSQKNREAIKLYNEDKLDEALSKWQDAQIESPKKKELHYNIGNALHQKGRYEDAYREYEKVLDSKDTDFEANTYYNMGNTNYRMGKLLEAIEDYEKTLEINPDDEDAKYNIEFIKEKLKEDMQREEDSESQAQEEKGQGTEESQKEKEQERGSEEERKSQGKKEEKKGQGQKDEEKDEEIPEENQAREEQRQGDMSEEDALRLLDALREDEMDLQKELRVHPGEVGHKVDKDW